MISLVTSGADERTRTADLLITNSSWTLHRVAFCSPAFGKSGTYGTPGFVLFAPVATSSHTVSHTGFRGPGCRTRGVEWFWRARSELPSCGHETPDHAKFCLDCASPFPIRCASCDGALPSSWGACIPQRAHAHVHTSFVRWLITAAAALPSAHPAEDSGPTRGAPSRLLKNSSSKGTFEGSPKGEM